MRTNLSFMMTVLVACVPDATTTPDPDSDPAEAPAVPEVPAADDAEDAPAGAPGRSGATPEPQGTTTGDGDADDDDDAESDTDGPIFILNPDGGGVSNECNYFAQDCPEGQKCNPWAWDGGTALNGTRCVPIVDHPHQEGEVCKALEYMSGLDTCDHNMMCWDVDPETLDGMCVAFCDGNEANPCCEDENKVCGGSKEWLICLETCDPLAPIGGPAEETEEGLDMCPVGCACYPQNEDFVCAPDNSGDMGAPGDPCEFINVCDPGSFCLGAAAITTCESAGCCVPACDLDDPLADETCAAFDPGTSCEAWYASDQAPQGYEDVGVCVVPG